MKVRSRLANAVLRGVILAQNILVIIQVASTLVLLVASGLLLRTILKLWNVDPGFDRQHVITFRVGLSPSLTTTAANTRTAYRQLLHRIHEIPAYRRRPVVVIDSVLAQTYFPHKDHMGQLITVAHWRTARTEALIERDKKASRDLEGKLAFASMCMGVRMDESPQRSSDIPRTRRAPWSRRACRVCLHAK